MATRIQLRRDTAANWAEFDPVLAEGEIAFDETAIELRIGNGTDPWSELPTFGTGGGGGGAVDSVNGHTGVVHLTEDDIPDGTTAKQYTSAEKTKLAGVATGATQNQPDAYLLDRAHQTGSQVAATISDLAETTQDTVAAMLIAGAHITLTYDDTANTLTITGAAAPVASVAGRTGAVVLSSADLTDAATLVTDDELAAALESALAGYVETAQLPLLVSDSLAAGANIGLHFDTGTQKTTITAAGGGGGGSVDSVNGQSGIVELDQDDIADGTTAKQYTAAEKTKLAGIAAGAEVNVNADWTAGSGDSQILNKPTLGSAAAAASTDFATAAQGSKADTAVQPAGLTKAAVGLGNVDNTADSAKPVSTAQAAAIALKYTKPGTGIPSTDLTTAVQTSLGKADTALQTAPVTSVAGRTGAITLTAADAGAVPTTRTVNSKALSSDVALTQDDVLDGTTAKQYTATEKTKLAGIAAGAEVNVNADWASGSGDSQILNKPTLGTAAAAATSDFATAAQGAKADSALQSAPVTSVAGKTGAVALAKGDVGLGSVDNTADAAKPVSTAQQTALDGKLATAAFLNGLTGVWIGTQAQYAALGSYTSTVLYAITP